jgi:hypothetical protein
MLKVKKLKIKFFLSFYYLAWSASLWCIVEEMGVLGICIIFQFFMHVLQGGFLRVCEIMFCFPF